MAFAFKNEVTDPYVRSHFLTVDKQERGKRESEDHRTAIRGRDL